MKTLHKVKTLKKDSKILATKILLEINILKRNQKIKLQEIRMKKKREIQNQMKV